jgi:hypothetical protein
MMISLVVIFGLLAVVGVLVAYGTAAKNKWGINLDPVSCPRCNTAAPTPREPQSLRQARWGDWTCPVCGAEVDKWGREVASVAPRGGVKAKGQMRTVLKKRFIIILAVGYFCLTLLFDWVGVKEGTGFPSTWHEALFQVGAAIVETAIFTLLFFLAWSYLGKRFLLTERGRDPAREHESDRNREA